LWVVRDGVNDDASLLTRALRGWTPPAGDGHVWIAAEAMTARALRDYMLVEREHPKAWLKAGGYWVRGQAGASSKMEV
jgi:NADPH-dependent ferric siderophore reductase